VEAGGQLHASAALRPRKAFPVSIEYGSWMDSRIVPEALEKTKIPCLYQESSHDPSVFQPTA